MSDHVSLLQPGYYVGIIRSTQSFRLDEGKFTRKGNSKPVQSFEELFEQYAPSSKRPVRRSPQTEGGRPTPGTGKTTSHSGWVSVVDPQQVKTKAVMAPEVYKASGGDDPARAEVLVANFKKNAARILGELADSGAMDDEVIAGVREINKNACAVQLIRVKLLWVSDKPIPGGRQSGKSKTLWYKEICLRKFYLVDTPADSLLTSLAEAIADPTLVVNASGHLVVKKSVRSLNGQEKSSFTIGTVAWSDKDMDVKRVLDWVQKRCIDSGSSVI